MWFILSAGPAFDSSGQKPFYVKNSSIHLWVSFLSTLGLLSVQPSGQGQRVTSSRGALSKPSCCISPAYGRFTCRERLPAGLPRETHIGQKIGQIRRKPFTQCENGSQIDHKPSNGASHDQSSVGIARPHDPRWSGEGCRAQWQADPGEPDLAHELRHPLGLRLRRYDLDRWDVLRGLYRRLDCRGGLSMSAKIVQLRDFKRKEEQAMIRARFEEVIGQVDTAPCELPQVWPDFHHRPDSA